MKYFVDWAGRTRVVEVVTDKAGTRVLVDGVPHRAEIEPVEGTGLYSLLLDRRSVSFAARFDDGAAVLQFHDREVRVPVEDERTREAHRATAGTKKAAGQGIVKAVMPGVVKDVRVAGHEEGERGGAEREQGEDEREIAHGGLERGCRRAGLASAERGRVRRGATPAWGVLAALLVALSVGGGLRRLAERRERHRDGAAARADQRVHVGLVELLLLVGGERVA